MANLVDDGCEVAYGDIEMALIGTFAIGISCEEEALMLIFENGFSLFSSWEADGESFFIESHGDFFDVDRRAVFEEIEVFLLLLVQFIFLFSC